MASFATDEREYDRLAERADALLDVIAAEDVTEAEAERILEQRIEDALMDRAEEIAEANAYPEDW